MRLRTDVVVAWMLVVLGSAASAAPWVAADAARAPGPAPARGVVVLPVDGPFVRLFEAPATPYGAGHRGVDIAAWPDTPVRAALPGTVVFAGVVAGRGWVTVDHGGGLETTYGDLGLRLVAVGRRVRGGDVLGRLAGGRSWVDWGARRDGDYIDPLTLLGRWEVHLAEG